MHLIHTKNGKYYDRSWEAETRIFKESGQKIIPYEHLRSGSQKLQTVQVKMMVIESSAPPVRASPPAEQNHQQKDKHRFTRFRHHREREMHGLDK